MLAEHDLVDIEGVWDYMIRKLVRVEELKRTSRLCSRIPASAVLNPCGPFGVISDNTESMIDGRLVHDVQFELCRVNYP